MRFDGLPRNAKGYREASAGIQLELRRQFDFLADVHALAESRKVKVEVRRVSENAALPCAPRLASLLSSAVRELGHDVLMIPSGAGHDAVAMSALTDAGTLFVRCKGGVSHSPAESVTEADVAVAIDVLSRMLELLARRT